MVGDEDSAIQSLGDLGISINNKNLLEVDQTKFNAAVTNHYADVGTLFAKSAYVSDSDVRTNSIASTVKAGNYPIYINSPYTPGSPFTGTIGD